MKNILLFAKFKYKSNIRSLIRRFSDLSIKLSSLYKIRDFYYLLISTQNVEIKEFELRHDDYKILDVDFLDNVEQLLFEWAKNEVESSFKVIQYENCSTLSKNGRILYAPCGEQILKSFECLADMMLILNYTTNSFSDGGRYNKIDIACEHILSQVEQGAVIVDLGVEASNPRVAPISYIEEIAQLKLIILPIIELKRQHKFLLSIDTYHAETISWLLDSEVDIINDISGNLAMNLVAECIKHQKLYIAMHNMGIPIASHNIIPIQSDPILHILKWMEQKIEQLTSYNIDLKNIIFDPGIGFGNNPSQAWYIINNLEKLKTISPDSSLLLGHSRKSFFGHITHKKYAKLDIETAVVAAKVAHVVDYLRLHDIAAFNNIYPIWHYS